MKTMEKLYTNTGALAQRMNEVNQGREKLQAVIDEVKGLNIIEIKKTEELRELITQGLPYINGRLEGMISESTKSSNLAFGPFRIRRGALTQLLDLPDLSRLEAFIAACEPYKFSLNLYQLESGKIVLNKAEVERLEETYSVTAKTKDELTLVNNHRKAAEALSSLQEAMFAVYGHSYLRMDVEISKLFVVKQDGIEINPYFYQRNGLRKQNVTVVNNEQN